MVTTTKDLTALNPQTTAVMSYMVWNRSAKQMVGEFFGLREEAVYDDEWENVIDFISDFSDERALIAKKVHLHPKLVEKGITEQMFRDLFKKVTTPDYAREKQQSDNGNTTEDKKESWLSDSSEWVESNKVKSWTDDIQWTDKPRAKRKTRTKKK